MSILLIAVAIVGSVVVWPINRWVIHHGGRPAVYGFTLCMTGAILSGIVVMLTRQALDQPAIWVVGAAIGVAFALGFCLVVMYCLQIGPAGPTVVMNNMGIVWPIVLGAVWLKPHPLNAFLVLGVLLVILALIGFGFSRPATTRRHDQGAVTSADAESAPERRISARWAFWAFVAWILAGISQTSQLVGSIQIPNAAVAITFAFNVTATLVLAPLVMREAKSGRVLGKTIFHCREIVGGLLNGVIQVLGLVALLVVLTRVGAEVVFPFTIAGPMIVVLILGHYVYHERLDRTGWIACGLGIIGLLVLSASQ